MARKHVSARSHAKRFNNTSKFHKKINTPTRSMRGGIRL